MKKHEKSLNSNFVKKKNRALIIKLLCTYNNLSRASLARKTGLTKTSLTNITNELLSKGYILETKKQDTKAGRKPTLLEIKKNVHLSLGVYISRDKIHGVLLDLTGRIIYKTIKDISANCLVKAFMDDVLLIINDVLKEAKKYNTDIMGIGIASVGPIDVSNGIILDPPDFRGLKNIEIVKTIKEKFDLPVFLDNDMNASALAEKIFGSAKRVVNFIYVGITNGIGAGIFIDNKLYRGSSGFAGELGHTTIDIHGPLCSCGNKGCLEIYSSTPKIVSKIQNSIKLGELSEYLDKTSKWEDIAYAYIKDDTLAKKVIKEQIKNLSVALVNMVNLFDPDKIYIGHEFAYLSDNAAKELEGLINNRILFKEDKKIKVEMSKFRENAPETGSASIVFERLFNGEIRL